MTALRRRRSQSTGGRRRRGDTSLTSSPGGRGGGFQAFASESPKGHSGRLNFTTDRDRHGCRKLELRVGPAGVTVPVTVTAWTFKFVFTGKLFRVTAGSDALTLRRSIEASGPRGWRQLRGSN
jgi:hypothetical protein